MLGAYLNHHKDTPSILDVNTKGSFGIESSINLESYNGPESQIILYSRFPVTPRVLKVGPNLFWAHLIAEDSVSDDVAKEY